MEKKVFQKFDAWFQVNKGMAYVSTKPATFGTPADIISKENIAYFSTA
jgi:hypothetical protein